MTLTGEHWSTKRKTCHSATVHHKFHVHWSRTENRSLQWEACN